MSNMNFILHKLKSEKGAIDKVLVTLLFVIIALGALVGLEQWTSSQKSGLVDKSNTVINSVMKE